MIVPNIFCNPPSNKANIFERNWSETVTQICSVKKLFLEMLKNSQENTCARVSLLIKLQVAFSKAPNFDQEKFILDYFSVDWNVPLKLY